MKKEGPVSTSPVHEAMREGVCVFVCLFWPWGRGLPVMFAKWPRDLRTGEERASLSGLKEGMGGKKI